MVIEKGELYGKESSKEKQEETTTVSEEEKEIERLRLRLKQPTEDEILKFALSGVLVGKCKICNKIIVMENGLNHQCHLPSPL